MRTRTYLLVVLCFGLCSMLFAVRKPLNESSWTLQGSIFFLEHTGGDLSFECQATHPNRTFTEKTRCGTTPAILVTLYTPEEHIYQDFYWRDENNELAHSFKCTIPSAAKGVWQIRVSMDEQSKFTYKFNTSPSKINAVMPARCWLWHQEGGKLDNTYFLVPPNAKDDLKINAFNCTIELFDTEGKNVAKVDNVTQNVKLERGKIYNYRNSTKQESWNWSGYLGYPVIFCENADVAEKLNASLIKMDDGQYVPLAVSKRILEWKKTLKPEDFAVPEVDLMQFKEAFLADEQSKCLLEPIGPMASAPYLIANQDLNPASPKFGSAPCDIGALAFLYSLDKPYNPYYKCQGLLNRVALYYLDSATRSRPIHENGTLFETSSNYAGADGMLQIQECSAYALLANALPDNVKEMWTEILGYPCRRFFSDRVSCENQSAHWPAKLFLYAQGSQNKIFTQMATDYIRNLSDTTKDCFIRTGYFQEAYGPDGSYIGITACVLAYYTVISHDPEAYKLMDRIYTFMNHTVAPEPKDGKIYGASGFAHRTPGAWCIRQYGGGSRMIADKLDSAACWHQNNTNAPWNDDTITKKITWIQRNALTYYKNQPDYASVYAFGPYAHIWYNFPFVLVKKGAVLPVIASENFDRNFNDEFYYFRRPSYYSGAYALGTATPNTSWNNDKIYGGTWTEKNSIMMHGSASGFSPLQGPQLFWTPKYGMSLVSMNWNIYTQWNAWLKSEGKPKTWPDYFTVQSKYDNTTKTLTISHKFRKSQASVERKLQFGDTALKVSVSVSGDLSGATLVEQLPYVNKTGIRVEFRVNGTWQSEPAEQTSAIRWGNENNDTVTLTFATPIAVRKSITSESQNVQIASLEAETTETKIEYTLN